MDNVVMNSNQQFVTNILWTPSRVRCLFALLSAACFAPKERRPFLNGKSRSAPDRSECLTPPHANTNTPFPPVQHTQGVVQRSYNAFPVYLRGATPDDYTNLGPRPGPCKTVAVTDTTDISQGEVCIEMWIRQYSNGVMSRMLQRIAKVRQFDFL